MATFTFLGRSRIEPGDERVTPSVNVGGIMVCEARIDPNVVDFDDPSLIISIRFERSDDNGQTWDAQGTLTIVGGSRTKDGNFPYDSVGNNNQPFPVGTLLRLRYAHNLSKRIGLAGETR